ncbi:MAG: hypothetical protein NT018_07695, partial [Armatimonadetes bacterium]|nr:hypothetical protein [Armatimonadota bacterium]
MNRKFLVCLFVLAISVSASSAFAVDQLLTNPGFEDGLTNWNGSYLDAGGICSVDTTEFHSGLQSLKTIAGAVSSLINGARQYGPGTGWALPVGSSVTFSAWIKVPAATTGNKFRYRFYVHYPTGTKVVGPVDITQNAWKQYTTTFSTLLTPIDWVGVQVYSYAASIPTSNFIYY